MYDYQATVIEWHDGDTVKLRIDEGFGNSITCWIRFYGVSIKELDTAEGQAALAYCNQHWPPGTPVYVTTKKPSTGYREFEGKQLGQTFARWLGNVYPTVYGGYTIGEILIQQGWQG